MKEKRDQKLLKSSRKLTLYHRAVKNKNDINTSKTSEHINTVLLNIKFLTVIKIKIQMIFNMSKRFKNN